MSLLAARHGGTKGAFGVSRVRATMPIKFACPHCKKGLSVKDHLAGKRAACPACKKALTIPKGSSTNHPALRDITVRPVPTAPPLAKPPISHQDAEAAAAEALADDSSETQKQAATVDFNCSFCDAELKLDAALAGKKTSCPECRRIIKVPELAKPDVADWRKAARTGPVGAKGPDVPERST
jgi:transcription elongation factor Elf1